MEWNIVPECVSLVFISILLVYSREYNLIRTLKNRLFYLCIRFVFFEVILSIISIIAIVNFRMVPVIVNQAIQTMFFLASPFLTVLFTLYIIAVVCENDPRLPTQFWITAVPYALYALLVLTNPVTALLYNIGEPDGFIYGKGYLIVYIIPILYMFAMPIIILFNYRKEKRALTLILLSFPILSLIMVGIQWLYPEIILSGSAATSGLMIVYLYLQNKQITLDDLTGLQNREAFSKVLEICVRQKSDMDLVLISLDDFKIVNDRYGRLASDGFLKAISEFLKKIVPIKSVYRFSGDEFIIILNKDISYSSIDVVRIICKRFGDYWDYGNNQAMLATSIAVVKFPDDANTVESVIALLEYCVDLSKRTGKGKVIYSDAETKNEMNREIWIIDQLKQGLVQDTLEGHYKPIYSTKEKRFMVAELIIANEELALKGEEIRRNESRLRRLVDILQYPSNSVQDFLKFALDQSIELTESKLGFICHYDEEHKDLVLDTWSKEVMAECTIDNQPIHNELEKTGLWGEAIRQRKPIIFNDYEAAHPLKKGYPEGHVKLTRFMEVPILKDERIVGAVGLANKETDYKQEDVIDISLLMEVVWKVTENKQSEAEKASLEVQLQQSQKMEAVGLLAGGVAHDFNNMLGVILGNTEMVLGNMDPAQPLHSNLLEIQEAAQHSAILTRQLLAFARKQTIVPEVLDLNETLGDLIKMLQRLIGENITLSWQRIEGQWLVNMDPSQLYQILTNLCVNARDAISNVGKITIETGNSIFQEDYWESQIGTESGEFVHLAVSDNGCGMDKETIVHIFEPFFTTKEMGKGTGLGLSTVYGIVKQNNGFINVTSDPGQGTTIKVFLPRYKGEDRKAKNEIGVKSIIRGQETILVAEDETSILNIVVRMLEKQGYTVLASSIPNEVIGMAKEHPGEIHLLLTDVVMPDMNGWDLAQTLLSIYPGLKCLFMTGYAGDIIAPKGILDDVVNIIPKPFSLTELSAKIRETLDSK